MNHADPESTVPTQSIQERRLDPYVSFDECALAVETLDTFLQERAGGAQ